MHSETDTQPCLQVWGLTVTVVMKNWEPFVPARIQPAAER